MLTSSYKIYKIIKTEGSGVFFFYHHSLLQTCGNASKRCYCGMHGGGSHKAWVSTCECVHCETLHYICMRVIVHTHCIMGHNIQSFFPSSPPPGDSPSLLLHHPYRGRPLILARSGVGQKETSAHWENALIIHDHLTIQDLLWPAYVAFHISARLPHLLMAVSLIVVLCSAPFKWSQNNNSARSAASWLLQSQAEKQQHLSVCQSRGDGNKDVCLAFFFISFICFAVWKKFECVFFNVWHHTAYCLAVLLSGMYRKCSLRGISDTQTNNCGPILPFFYPYFFLTSAWFLTSASFLLLSLLLCLSLSLQNLVTTVAWAT